MSKLTEEQLKAIQDRAAAATPGPWRVHKERVELDLGTIVDTADIINEQGAACNGFSDYPFMAHARQDIPLLCAALRHERAENARLQDNVIELNQQVKELLEIQSKKTEAAMARVKIEVGLRVENQRLREALEFYANPESWKGQLCVGDAGIPWVCETTEVDSDLGDRARAALKSGGGE